MTTTKTPTTRRDLALFALSLELYEGVFKALPSWTPEDEIDVDHLLESLRADRDLMASYTSSMLETVAAAIPLWVAGNYQLPVDKEV